MNVLYKRNQEKSKRNDGVYSCEFFQKMVRKIRFLGQLQNDPGKLLNEVRVLPG